MGFLTWRTRTRTSATLSFGVPSVPRGGLHSARHQQTFHTHMRCKLGSKDLEAGSCVQTFSKLLEKHIPAYQPFKRRRHRPTWRSAVTLHHKLVGGRNFQTFQAAQTPAYMFDDSCSLVQKPKPYSSSHSTCVSSHLPVHDPKNVERSDR